MKYEKVFSAKIDRIRSGSLPRALDLFAGCGGLSLGFDRAGYDIAGAIEFDPHAARSHAENFLRHLSSEERAKRGVAIDITQVEPAKYVQSHLGSKKHDSAIDVIVGGPPCQAFARVGRAKLREIAEHPEAFRLDPRGVLYLRYLDYVKELKPLVIVMENVPDVLNYAGHNIAEEMCETLDDLGYSCRYTLLNAVHYGVPEMRERMFLLAYHESLGKSPEFPSPTHVYDLPQGYANSRSVALKTIKSDLSLVQRFFVASATPTNSLPNAVTAREAIGDLPPITAHLTGGMPRGARRFDAIVPYRGTEPSSYAREMRGWPGFEAGAGVGDHVIRSLPRDYAIFRRMNPGDQYPEAYKHANDLFNEALEEINSIGESLQPGSVLYEELRAKTVPPYDPGKFPNKWRKMAADEPARTLMAHLGKDGYSHIHYDSEQARTISVREAARLQSFPDGFIFSGTMNPAFRQIGNAVPPLLAYRLALRISTALGWANGKEASIKAADKIRPYVL